MNFVNAIAPTVIAEIEFVEVSGSGGGETASDPTPVPPMSWDNVTNKRWR